MLDTSINLLPHTSGLTKKRLHLVGIDTYEDLLKYPPNRYEDFSRIVKALFLRNFLDQKVTLQGEVVSIAVVKTRSHISLQKVSVQDNTGKVSITFFNQPYLLSQLKKGGTYAFSGTVKQFGPTYTLQPETFEPIISGEQGIQTGRILPVYSEAKGLSSRLLREKIAGILPLASSIQESLPESVVKLNDLLPLPDALKTLHRPLKIEDLQRAKDRLAFEELFLLQLSTALIKKNWNENKVKEIIKYTTAQEKMVERFVLSLPFKLTSDQMQAYKDIIHDLVKEQPMNRFLQGDVGSGKTVVAAISAYVAYLSKKKTLYMAPTEILALQHAETFKALLSPLGVKIGIQTGSKKELAKGNDFDIVIGTHALLSTPVSVSSVALVIIDEQHRFGVKQRALLKAKGITPHLLTMTATPIPRTVALTAFGELDMSVLSTMPTGRKPIRTYVVTQAKRNDAYTWIKKEIIKDKVQIFVICPLVEESEAETLSSVKAATTEFELLKKEFIGFTLGLLHGKMKPAEKNSILDDFRDKKIDILVSTSVVEVGIDIPNASIMIIEGAERFGLSQLHQLRGRVGRGSIQSHCLLFSSAPISASRLHFFAQTLDGMKLAEYDLKERGPGNIFGIEQHGFMEMRFASFSDSLLIQKTQKAVQEYLKTNPDVVSGQLNERLSKFQIDKIAKD
ncbi:MAG: ATP-dependent DNA helicase RecG [Candidatus Roizmanbacteria bacterium]|nr:ATP-dependent DNA helicase RecG [Candidatus Roizmanbacteria bacterium]